MAQETGNNGDEEMQGQRLYLLMWFMSSLEAACYSENNAIVYKKASSEGKMHTSCENIPSVHYAGHRPKDSPATLGSKHGEKERGDDKRPLLT